jgi:leucyl-tRNA synthetase
MHRFLQRLWRLIVDESTGQTLVDPEPPPRPEAPPGQQPPPDKEPPPGLEPPFAGGPLDAATARLLHRTIAAVREDFAALRFHTAIARIIELTAHASRLPRVPRALAEPLVLMVAPLAPHIAEELWQRLGHPSSLAREPFPQADPELAATVSVTLPVQVNGKVRFTIEVPAQASRQDIAELLAAHPAYPRENVARLVIVPGKIANVVLR